MLNNDDKIWLDTIAGKDVPEDANPDTVAEAQALRDAFHAEEQLQKLMSRIQPQSDELTFIEKLREWWASNIMTPVLAPLVVVVSFVGLLVVKMIPNPNNNDLKLPKSELKIQSDELTFIEKLREWWASNTITPVLAPLVVVISVVGIIVNITKAPSGVIPKSELKMQPLNSTEAIVKISPNPKQTAEQLKQNFVAAGAIVELTLIIEEQSYQLDIEMPTSASDKLRDLCDRIGINPKNRSVRIIVELAK